MSRIVLLIALVFSTTTQVANAQFRVARQNDWVSMWALNGQTDKAFAKQLESESQMRIKIMDRICELDTPQETKLNLAAEADISRFMRDVARIRAKLDGMEINNNDVNEAWQIVNPLTTRIQTGLFGKGSLFEKVVRSSLSKSQQGQYEAELQKNRERRWRAITRVNVADIEKAMPLLSDQRQKLLKLLDAIEVPKKLTKHMDGYVGYLRLIKVEEKDLKEFLDEHQMAVIEQYRQRYQGWARMFR